MYPYSNSPYLAFSFKKIVVTLPTYYSISPMVLNLLYTSKSPEGLVKTQIDMPAIEVLILALVQGPQNLYF